MWRVQRTVLQKRATDLLRQFRIVALLGPRQSGKTTLARKVASAIKDFAVERNYFDLEDPVHLDRLENPKLALEGLRGLVVIDEIQRRPELFPVLRVLADRPKTPARFLILGSASRDLIRQGSETLAGRIGFMEVTPFTLPGRDSQWRKSSGSRRPPRRRLISGPCIARANWI